MAKFREIAVNNKTALILLCMGFIALLFALIYYRDDIYQSLQDPGEPFQTYSLPPEPNYAEMKNWLAIPDLDVDPFSHETAGDAFIIVPSVYRGGEHWNLQTDNPKRRAQLERVVRPNYVKPYSSAGRLFAPYYRQAAIYSYFTAREDAQKAQNLAYKDIKRAFEYFLEHSPPERPIILVGHGQGGSHAQRLLADYFNSDLRERLAAAYIIDYPLPLDIQQSRFPGTPPCEDRTDTNCVVAYGAFMPGDKLIANRFLSELLVFDGKKYHSVKGRELICTNPLLWNRSTDYAPRRLHLGGVAAVGLDHDILPAPRPKQSGAQCQDGILYVDKPKSRSLRRPIKIGGKFRTLPSNLFYEDLRVNAVERVNSLVEAGQLPTRVKRLDNIEVIEIIESPVAPLKD